ncbi:hypothetical protein [Staphylococcus gallinarum]|uniref:hypothetical protein n=1 Tax=Staphylococcus gallinarum TaxID=1293 RepID=UPI0030C12B3E
MKLIMLTIIFVLVTIIMYLVKVITSKNNELESMHDHYELVLETEIGYDNK